jgi:hypothetical protein
MRDTEGECFELLDAQNLKLQKGKTYEVLRADAEGTVFFGQVALFITADYVCG